MEKMMNKVDRMIEMGLDVVDLERYEGTEKEVFKIENKIWELTKYGN